jgi:hypothetical protein
MKKLHIVGLALFALFAISAVAASSASAIEFLLALWLFNGNTFTGSLAVETTGSLLLEDTNAPLGLHASVVCPGTLDGTVNGANGEDEITKVLNSANEEVSSTPLVGLPIENCTNEQNCGSPLVWPAKPPWKTQLDLVELVTGQPLVIDLLINAGWYVECTTLGAKVTDECVSAEGAADLANLAGGEVEGTFSEKLTVTELGMKLALCTANNTETGVVEGSGKTKDTEGGPLTVSWEV